MTSSSLLSTAIDYYHIWVVPLLNYIGSFIYHLVDEIYQLIRKYYFVYHELLTNYFWPTVKVILPSEFRFAKSDGNAGFDLYANESVVIEPHSRVKVETGLYMEIPRNMYGQIFSRSGMATKNWIDSCGGVVDPNYRGPVGVTLHNHSDKPFKVERGDRIAQMVFLSIYHPTINTVKSVFELSNTDRGDKGFGSSGK